jgi:carbamoyl-phosphate synthase small subunit
MMGIISTRETDEKRLHERLRGAPGMAGRDLVPEVTCKASYEWSDPTAAAAGASSAGERVPIVVIDCGIKRSTLRYLTSLGGRVTVVPATTSADDILGLKPSGVLISNGPGDPAAVTYTIATVRSLLGRVPLFGICLGHQLLALALGGKTYKLKFGHRGGNQPVKDLATGQVHVSSHNHGFAVDMDSLRASEVEPWFTNLNDGTNEGLRCKTISAASVQFHPEAAPGPSDCRYLFADWIQSLERSPPSLQRS